MGLALVLVTNGTYAVYAISLLIVFTVLAYCIFQCHFHPLAKYPGPFLAKITDLYAGYHAWKGDIHIDMWKCHEKYGEFVRYSPNRLNINNTNAIRDIYREGKSFAKSPNYRVLRHQAANMFTMINKKEHARRRRIMAPLVSDTAIRRLEPTMLIHIKKCFFLLSNTNDQGHNSVGAVADASEGWTAARNMSHWSCYLSFDIVGDLIFGVKYDLLGRIANRYVFEAIDESNKRMSVLLQSPGIRSIGRIDRFLFPRAIEARNQFLGFITKLIEDTMDPKCTLLTWTLFSLLSSSKDPITGEGFSMKEIVAETTNLCVASVDTASTAMAATFFYLSKNKLAYERAVKEVRSTFSSVDDIRMDAALHSCVYLRACIDEALRLAPPAGSSLFRQVLEDGTKVDGELFPAGVELGVPIYSMHHTEQYFPDPFAFKPERWIPSETNLTGIKKAQSAYCPFSVGPRSCIGKSVALTELMLSMAIGLYTLDFKRDQSDTSGRFSRPDEVFTRDHITATINGPMINFRKR